MEFIGTLRKWFSLLVFFVGTKLCAQEQVLEIRVTNVKEGRGFMMLAVYDDPRLFLTNDAVTSAKKAVQTSNEVLFYLNNLSYGDYAISIYHDVNGNGELDTNFMGIPKEPYGFSNNNLGLMRIPKYEKSVFTYSEETEYILIELN